MLTRTPFFEIHKKYNAKLIDFGGFEMPVQYEGIKKEHMAVRERVGMFDVSHMGEFFITGKEALDLIQHVTINDATKLFPGRAQYSAMCYEDGGIVDDLIIYMMSEEEYMLVVNASNKDKDLDWINQNNTFDAVVTDKSDDMCLLAVQGPQAPKCLQSLTEINLEAIKFYHFEKGHFAGCDNVIISVTGYTGEAGFELYFDKNEVNPETIWEAIMEAGKDFDIAPAGLGARDTLRLEMGYALYGNDISKDTHPFEARLGWITKLDKGSFIGKGALLAIKEKGSDRKTIGFEMAAAKKIPRQGYEVTDGAGTVIGQVTSGGMSVLKDKGIGMAIVSKDALGEKENVFIKIRNNEEEAIVVTPPFIRK